MEVVTAVSAGALRGGTHLHLFSGDGRWVSFTYEDYLLATGGAGGEINQRNVGVSVLGFPGAYEPATSGQS